MTKPISGTYLSRDPDTHTYLPPGLCCLLDIGFSIVVSAIFGFLHWGFWTGVLGVNIPTGHWKCYVKWIRRLSLAVRQSCRGFGISIYSNTLSNSVVVYYKVRLMLNIRGD